MRAVEAIPEADEAILRRCYLNHPTKVLLMTADGFLRAIEFRVFYECENSREELHEVLNPRNCNAYRIWLEQEIYYATNDKGLSDAEIAAIRETLLSAVVDIGVVLFTTWKGHPLPPKNVDDDRNLRRSLQLNGNSASQLLALPSTNGHSNGNSEIERGGVNPGKLLHTLSVRARGRATREGRTILPTPFDDRPTSVYRMPIEKPHIGDVGKQSAPTL